VEVQPEVQHNLRRSKWNAICTIWPIDRAPIAALGALLWQHVETQFFSISPATCYGSGGERASSSISFRLLSLIIPCLFALATADRLQLCRLGFDGNRHCDWSFLPSGTSAASVDFGGKTILQSHYGLTLTEQEFYSFGIGNEFKVERTEYFGWTRSERVYNVSCLCIFIANLIAADFVAHMNYGFSSVFKSVVESHSFGLHFGSVTRLYSALNSTFPLSVSGPWEVVSSAPE